MFSPFLHHTFIPPPSLLVMDDLRDDKLSLLIIQPLSSCNFPLSFSIETAVNQCQDSTKLDSRDTVNIGFVLSNQYIFRLETITGLIGVTETDILSSCLQCLTHNVYKRGNGFLKLDSRRIST